MGDDDRGGDGRGWEMMVGRGWEMMVGEGMGEVGCMLGGRACGCRSWGEGNGRRGENEWASWISNYMYVCVYKCS